MDGDVPVIIIRNADNQQGTLKEIQKLEPFLLRFEIEGFPLLWTNIFPAGPAMFAAISFRASAMIFTSVCSDETDRLLTARGGMLADSASVSYSGKNARQTLLSPKTDSRSERTPPSVLWQSYASLRSILFHSFYYKGKAGELIRAYREEA